MRVNLHWRIADVAALIVPMVAVLALSASPALAAHGPSPGAHGRYQILATVNAGRPTAVVAVISGPAFVSRDVGTRGAPLVSGRVFPRYGLVVLGRRGTVSPLGVLTIALATAAAVGLVLVGARRSARREQLNVATAAVAPALQVPPPADQAAPERRRKAA